MGYYKIHEKKTIITIAWALNSYMIRLFISWSQFIWQSTYLADIFRNTIYNYTIFLPSRFAVLLLSSIDLSVLAT